MVDEPVGPGFEAVPDTEAVPDPEVVAEPEAVPEPEALPDHRVMPAFEVVPGIDALEARHGPLFAVVGVFDGLHLGHRWLLDALIANARRAGAQPTVITFDSHPDEVLVGAAPPLLLDPVDRQRLLRDAGVSVVVVQHFDAALRTTPYDAFVGRITDRVRLAGLLMTPDAAFGHERRGTPDALAALGHRSDPPFEVVVVPTFVVDGRPVSSSEIRRRVATGDLAAAAAALGRPYGVSGRPGAPDADSGTLPLEFDLPVALPPLGRYPVSVVDADVAGPARPAIAVIGTGPGELALEMPAGSLDAATLAAVPRLRVVFG